MGFIRKKNSDFELLDLTLLQKKGILKLPKEDQAARSDMLDLTVPFPAPPPDSVSANSSSFSPFGMLDNLAQAGSSVAPEVNKTENSNDVNAMKIKLDDFEYKIERLIERLEKIESRLSGNEL